MFSLSNHKRPSSRPITPSLKLIQPREHAFTKILIKAQNTEQIRVYRRQKKRWTFYLTRSTPYQRLLVVFFVLVFFPFLRTRKLSMCFLSGFYSTRRTKIAIVSKPFACESVSRVVVRPHTVSERRVRNKCQKYKKHKQRGMLGSEAADSAINPACLIMWNC